MGLVYTYRDWFTLTGTISNLLGLVYTYQDLFTLTWTSLGGGGLQVLARHLVEDLHECCDEAVYVTLVVHAGRLQDHQGAEQLGGGSIG